MHVFEMIRDWADEAPVTVFAGTVEEACRIYRDWVDAHHPSAPPQPTMIYCYHDQWRDERPVLARVAKQGRAGIGYWSATAERWLVGDPGDAPLGRLIEPTPNVGYYRFEAEEGEDAMVFASSFEEATTLYCAYQLDRWGELPTRFSVRTMSRWDLRGDLVTLRDGMEADITGVGMRDERGVWRILPPDWEPPVRR